MGLRAGMWRRGWWRNWRRDDACRLIFLFLLLLLLLPRRSSAVQRPLFLPMPPPRQFDHEKLQVYQLELQFISWLTDLFAEIQASKTPRLSEVIDQLDRGSLSALLNTAEGNGRRASQQRVRFFDDARGSATESAACLDAIVAKRACRAERIDEGKDMLLSIVSILSALIARFEKPATKVTPKTRGAVRRPFREEEEE